MFELSERIASDEFAKLARHPDDPEAFTRSRKLPLPALISALQSMRNELIVRGYQRPPRSAIGLPRQNRIHSAPAGSGRGAGPHGDARPASQASTLARLSLPVSSPCGRIDVAKKVVVATV